MAGEDDLRRGAKTTERIRRGGLRGAAYAPRDFDVDGRACDGCAEVIEPTDKFRTLTIAGEDFQLHDACYYVWVNFRA
jgi:hypothetical protein